MMTPPTGLVSLLKPWADFYSDSKAVSTTVTFLHLGGLLLAGGLAIAADRNTLRALRRSADERATHLRDLAETHRWVLLGLAIIAVSGVMQLTADLATFWGSPVYWTKATLVGLLLLNGYLMTRTERALGHDGSDGSPHWGKLRRAAVNSLVLWFATAAFGVALVNYS